MPAQRSEGTRGSHLPKLGPAGPTLPGWENPPVRTGVPGRHRRSVPTTLAVDLNERIRQLERQVDLFAAVGEGIEAWIGPFEAAHQSLIDNGIDPEHSIVVAMRLFISGLQGIAGQFQIAADVYGDISDDTIEPMSPRG
jgi:hypothetical protein